MAKLIPPAIQNLKKRETFFKANPEYPNSAFELETISKIKAYKNLDSNWNTLPKKQIPQDGVEYYKKLKQQYTIKKDSKKQLNPFKRLMRMFNRGK